MSSNSTTFTSGTVIAAAWLNDVNTSTFIDRIDVKKYGAIGNGIADDTAAINAANVIATTLHKTLYFPSGTYIASNIPVIAGMNWEGQSSATSIIKLKSGTNATLVSCPSSADYDNVKIRHLRFDGNRANNTSGGGLSLRGLGTELNDVTVIDVAGIGIITDALGTTPLNGGPIGYYCNVSIQRTNQTGWKHMNWADAHFDSIMICDAGIGTDNTYYGLWIAGSNGRFSNVHVWSNTVTYANTPKYGVFLDASGGNDFVNCHFEAGYTCLYVTGGGNTFDGCHYYASRGTYAVSLGSSGNILKGVLGILQYSTHNYMGVNLMNTTGAGNIVDLSIPWASGLLEVVDFTNSGGYNTVKIRGYRQSTNVVAGTALVTDEVDIYLNGTGGVYVLPWTTFTPTITSGTGSLTTVSATGKYQKINSVVNFYISITITNIGTAGLNIKATLPITSATAQRYAGSGRENASSGTPLTWYNDSTTAVVITKYDGTFLGANGYRLDISGTYEAN